MDSKDIINYIDKVAYEEENYHGKTSKKYNEYLAICQFSLYGVSSIDKNKYKIEYNEKKQQYYFQMEKVNIPFNLYSNILKKEYEQISQTKEKKNLTDEEYEYFDFLLDEINNLMSFCYRNRCHELSYQKAILYNMKAVTGLLTPKCKKLTLFHSWLENDKYVIDVTNNLIFEKVVFNRYVVERVNEIDSKELKGYGEEINGYYTLLYLAAEKKLSKNHK